MKYTNYMAALLFAAATIAGCSKSTSSNLTTYNGTPVALGSGTMNTFIQTDASGKPTSVGFTINEAALNAMPTTDSMFMLALPAMSGSMNMNMTMPTPFDHIEVDWSANGDTGTVIFNHPHLDCHFFMISSMSQMGIMMGSDTFSVGSDYMPQNCMGDAMDEGGMGVHVWDTLAPEYHGSAFTHSYMYGFYHGNMDFVEIMCARSFLDSKANYTGDMSQPNAFKVHGYYPLKYTVSYDAGTKTYTYAIVNLMYH
jgi:Domain of unknown function (DUF5602)